MGAKSLQRPLLLTMIRHLFCIAAASALLAPSFPRAAPAAPLSMGVEVGGGIKTVSATIAAFESNYPKPVATLWRSPINDMLQTTHLSVVNQDFKYDALFGYGFLTLMDLIMGTYPVAGEGDKITDALISALDFDPQQVRADSAAIKAAVEGSTEADLLAAAASGSAIGSCVAEIKSRSPYFHTRPGSVGLLNIMDAVNVPTDKAGIERWAEPFGYRTRPLENMS